jgi:thioredoxin 1
MQFPVAVFLCLLSCPSWVEAFARPSRVFFPRSSATPSSSSRLSASTLGRDVEGGVSGKIDFSDFAPHSNHQLLENIDDAAFFHRVLDGADPDALSVVVFSSGWCAPCQAMESSLVRVAMTHRNSASFYRLDTDNNNDAPSTYQVRQIPSTLFFKGSTLVSEIVGAVPASIVASQIEKHSASAPSHAFSEL